MNADLLAIHTILLTERLTKHAGDFIPIPTVSVLVATLPGIHLGCLIAKITSWMDLETTILEFSGIDFFVKYELNPVGDCADASSVFSIVN